MKLEELQNCVTALERQEQNQICDIRHLEENVARLKVALDVTRSSLDAFRAGVIRLQEAETRAAFGKVLHNS